MTHTDLPHGSAQRLVFLDWLRILAFGLLVLYHVGMYYVSWDWHIKSPHANSLLEPLMRASSPWRLGMLFLLSGAASSLMFRRSGATGALLAGRSKRLLAPIVFGIAVIVPPQSYFEVVSKGGYAGSYADFLALYFTAYSGFCKAPGQCLILPTWNHLWFVVYLLVYTLALWGLVRAWPTLLERLASMLLQALRGARLLALPVAVLALLRLTLYERFPPTHALVDDFYLHASYFALFVTGAALAREPVFWGRMNALRWPALSLAVLAWVVMMGAVGLLQDAATRTTWIWLPRTAVAAMQWCAIVAAIGFAQ